MQKALSKNLHEVLRWLLLPLAMLCLLLFARQAHALALTNYFEAVLVPNVSTSWTTVALDNSYSDAIPVCTYVLESFVGTAPNYTYPPAVTRIRNITATSFDLRIQGWEDSTAATSDVHCIVVDSGAHTLPDGRNVEAYKISSDQTSGQYATDGDWGLALVENVSSTIVLPYTNPVAFGQVMSYNDNRASVIYMNDCDSRLNQPFHSGLADGICVGKHIGQIASSRATETVGYIVAESGSGTVNNVFYEVGLGTDTVAGNNTANVGYTYPSASHHTVAVLTQAGIDGINGSWATLYGSDPLQPSTIGLAVDEEVFERDTTRIHTREPVFYWAFSGAEITLVKKLVNDSGGSATLSDFVLSAAGIDNIAGVSGTATVTKAVVHPGTYTLSETSVPRYTSSAWNCIGASAFSGDKIKLQAGDHVVCTITNDDDPFATLTLVKNVINDNDGDAVVADFSMSFSSATTSGSGVTGAPAVTSVVVPADTYTLSELPVDGYLLLGIRCDGSDSDGLDGVTIAVGEKVTCTFINDDQGVDLQISKTANNLAPNIGEQITFTVEITNAGPHTATDVQVIDPIPAGFTYVASSINGGDSVDDSAPTFPGLGWTINSLPVGGVASLTFQAIVVAP